MNQATLNDDRLKQTSLNDRPFRHYTQKHCMAAQAQLVAALNKIKQDWPVDGFEVKVANACDLADEVRHKHKGYQFQNNKNDHVYVYSELASLTKLSWSLLSVKSSLVSRSATAEQFAVNISNSFVLQLLEVNNWFNGDVEINQQNDWPEYIDQAFSGWLAVSMTLHTSDKEQLTMHWLLNPSLSANLTHYKVASSGRQLSDRNAAIKRQKASIELEIPAVNVDLGQIKDIQVGDVIELEHLVDEPLSLTIDKVQFSKAYLAKQGQHKAVQIVA